MALISPLLWGELRSGVDTKPSNCHAGRMIIKTILLVFGLCAIQAHSSPDHSAAESVRMQLIEVYQGITSTYFEASSTEIDRVDRFAVRSDGVCSHRTHMLQSLIQHHRFDPDEALADWLDVAVDYVFFNGKDTSIGPFSLDTYIVHEREDYPKPWGANPMHPCPWPMVAGWAQTGELTPADSGGWVLKVPDRHLWIAFDDHQRIIWVEHKYDADEPSHTRWTYSGYDDDAQFYPKSQHWVMKIYDQQGELSSELSYEASLKFDPERAENALPFKRPDGSVNLISPNEAMAKRTARESGRSLKSVLNDPSCGPLELGFKRYDPETGDVYSPDGKVIYNLKKIQTEPAQGLEPQN